MNKAIQWLSDAERSFAEGLRLYVEVFGTDKHYDFFAGASDPSIGSLHFNMLEEKIRKAARLLVPDQNTEEPKTETSSREESLVKTCKPASGKVRIVDNPLVDVTQLPESLQQLYFDNKRMTMELAAEHASLKTASDDQSRSLHLANAKRLEADRARNWSTIDAWWQENKGSISPGAGEYTANLKRKDTLRKAIHRAEGELASGTLDAKKTEARKSKLAAWKKELLALKK